jgi:hypothetical protein
VASFYSQASHCYYNEFILSIDNRAVDSRMQKKKKKKKKRSRAGLQVVF